GGIVAGDVRRQHRRRRGELTLEDPICEGVAADGHRERLPDLDVVGRWAGRVAGDKFGAGAREGLHPALSVPSPVARTRASAAARAAAGAWAWSSWLFSKGTSAWASLSSKRV